MLINMETPSFYVKILKWGIWISLFLPLVVFNLGIIDPSQYLSPFHFMKMIVFRILVELMAVFYFILILIDKTYRPKWTQITISLSIFVALYFFTGLVGVNFYNSFWGSLERMGGIFSLLHFWVYFLILTSIINSKEDWQKVLKISVFVGFLSILFGYGQRLRLGDFFVGWQHGERVIGTIGNPALFAGYLLFIIYLALLFLFKKDTSAKEKGFFAAVVILGVPILFMTAVRGAMLSLLGSVLLLMLFFVFKASQKKTRILLFIIVILALSLVIFAWANRNSSWVKSISWLNRLTDISKGTETIQTRLWSWTSAIKGWKEKPIFGWGPENFTYLHMKYFDPRHFTHLGSETIWDRAHNMVLEELSTMGIIGLLSYLSIFFFIFYFLIKRFKEQKIDKVEFGVLSAMIIAYFGQNLFIFDTFANHLLFFLSLGYINFLAFQKGDLLVEKNTGPTRRPSPFLITVLLILAILLSYQTGIKPAMANYACTRAIIAGRDGNAQKAFDKYRQALNFKTPQGAYEIRHKLASFVIQVVDSQRQKNKDVDPAILYYAIKETEKNVQKYPLDTTPYLYIGRMYILLLPRDSSAGSKAEEYIQKAIDLNPRNPRIWYEMGQAKLSQKKYQESYNCFKTALDLNPSVNLSWWFLSNVALQLGDYEEAVFDAEKAIAMGYNFKNSITDIMRLVSIYEKAGNYEKVLEHYLFAVEEQPQNPQLFASLASTYAKLGYKEEAVRAAQHAAELDPKFKEEAEKFIKSLE